GDLLTVAGTENTLVDDFLGGFLPTPDRGYEFFYGPLVVAMREGRPLLVDDATLIPPRVLAVLYPAMDGRGVITIPGYRNERVEGAAAARSPRLRPGRQDPRPGGRGREPGRDRPRRRPAPGDRRTVQTLRRHRHGPVAGRPALNRTCHHGYAPAPPRPARPG